MTKPAITTERVLDLISVYGADLGSWPQDERVAAETLIAANPVAFEAALADARFMDAALSEDSAVEPPAHLADAILKTAPCPTVPRKSEGWLQTFLPSGLRLPTGAALASLGIGLLAGYSYAGDTGFDAYLSGDSAYTDIIEQSFDDWLAQAEDGA